MASVNSYSSAKVAQLLADGMRQQGIPTRAKLEEICDLAQGYLQHLVEGHIRHPRNEILERLAHALGQHVETYRAALLADHNELPEPALYFSTKLGVLVDSRAAELGMEVVRELVSRSQRANE